MDQFKNKVDKALEYITITLLAVMLLVITWQVFARYILKVPNAYTEEFLRFSLIWLSMLSAAYIAGKADHISFTLIRDRLKPKVSMLVRIMVQFIFALFSCSVMIYGGLKAVSIAHHQQSPALNIPMSLVYISLPVSGVIILFYNIYYIRSYQWQLKAV